MSEKTCLYLLRSVYINDWEAKAIIPEFYYISLIKDKKDKISDNDFHNYVLKTYEELFSNRESLMKFQMDLSRYYMNKNIGE